jgi:hypothetical protein
MICWKPDSILESRRCGIVAAAGALIVCDRVKFHTVRFSYGRHQSTVSCGRNRKVTRGRDGPFCGEDNRFSTCKYTSCYNCFVVVFYVSILMLYERLMSFCF